MNELVKMKLFRLLSDTSQVKNEEMENAYGCFMEQIEAVCQSGKNYLEVFRMLNISRIELVFMESLYRYEQEKKCVEIILFQKIYPIP